MHNRFKYPDWARSSKKHDYPLSKNDELTRRAYIGCISGNLMPLARAIKEGSIFIEPLIAIALVGMIEGDDTLSDYQLDVKKNKTIGQKQTEAEKFKKWIEVNKIALYVAQMDGHRNGMYDSAIAAAMDKFGKSWGSVTGYWGEYLAQKNLFARAIAWEKTEDGKASQASEVTNPLLPPDNFMPNPPKQLRNKLIDDDLANIKLNDSRKS